MTMTYYGAEKVVPHYNVMGVAKAALEATTRYLAADLGPSGIRVNAISAGPVRTLSAHGIAGFRTMHNAFEEVTPLRRHITIEDVAGTAVYLASPLSGQTTGEVDLRGRRVQHPGPAGSVRGVGRSRPGGGQRSAQSDPPDSSKRIRRHVARTSAATTTTAASMNAVSAGKARRLGGPAGRTSRRPRARTAGSTGWRYPGSIDESTPSQMSV